jgi:hypothetical protein
VRDIGGGRVDILVNFYGYHFVIEAKRELRDASPMSLRSYLGQAGLYLGTNVMLGFLLVLDLTSKRHGVPSLRSNAWVEITQLSDQDVRRHIVVVRVPGNRIRPSATRLNLDASHD